MWRAGIACIGTKTVSLRTALCTRLFSVRGWPGYRKGWAVEGPAFCLPRAGAGACRCLRAVPEADPLAVTPRLLPQDPGRDPESSASRVSLAWPGWPLCLLQYGRVPVGAPFHSSLTAAPPGGSRGGGPQTRTPNPATSSPTIPRKTSPLLLDGIIFLIIISMENWFSKPGPWSLMAGDTGVKFTPFSG